MVIDNVAMNEYVHTDSVFRVGGHHNIIYEPTEEAFNKIHGTIYFEGGREWVGFRQSPTSDRLLVDCDDVLAGRVEGRVVHMLWNGDPGNHYLTVSYEIAREEPVVLPKTRRMVILPKPDWCKEGF